MTNDNARCLAYWGRRLLFLPSLLSAIVGVGRAGAVRVITEYLDDGTPSWRYVSDDFFEYGGGDHESRRRKLQENCDGYPDSFSQVFYVTIYDTHDTMTQSEIDAFEEVIQEIWNDPQRECFTDPCVRVDEVQVIGQELVEEEGHDDHGLRRRLFEARQKQSFNDDRRRLHRRKKNVVKNRAKGRCRRCGRKPIKVEDRRLMEAIYLSETDGNWEARNSRRLFACEDEILEALQDSDFVRRSDDTTGAFQCASSILVTARDTSNDRHCHF